MTELYEEKDALLDEGTDPSPDGQVAVTEMTDEAPPLPEDPSFSEENNASPAPAQVDYERLAAEDLAEIKRLDPAYAPAAHLGELPFARRFAQLRDMGLTVKEALAAAAPRFERSDGRAHLRAVAPHGGKAAPEGLSGREMQNARMLFGGLSDSEINALYRRVSKKND